MIFCNSEGSATMIGGAPVFSSINGGASGAPPLSSIAAPPVNPWISKRALVSFLIGDVSGDVDQDPDAAGIVRDEIDLRDLADRASR